MSTIVLRDGDADARHREEVGEKDQAEEWYGGMETAGPYEIEDEGRFTGMFQGILDLGLTKNLEEIEEAIMDWEQEIEDYEKQTTQTIADHSTRGILTKQLPEELKLQLQLQSSILNTYEKTKKCLTDYLLAKQVWSEKKNKDKDEIDVDAIACRVCGGKNPWGKQGYKRRKGKGTGKWYDNGKGKGTGK